MDVSTIQLLSVWLREACGREGMEDFKEPEYQEGCCKIVFSKYHSYTHEITTLWLLKQELTNDKSV